MGRAYAGVLGPLAFALCLARGIAAGSGVERLLLAASAALFVFAAMGYLIGQTADYLVSDSVRTQFQAAMAAWEAKQKQPTKTQSKSTT
jgi:hypothetical protein